MSTAVDILDTMPLDVDSIARWFRTMPSDDFDSVCLSAATLALSDEKDENGFISVRSINVLMAAMRDRYRDISAGRDSVPAPALRRRRRAASGHLNDVQARILLRLRPVGNRPPEHLNAKALAEEVFKVPRHAVYHVWAGDTHAFASEAA